jgi:hypothetical protein
MSTRARHWRHAIRDRLGFVVPVAVLLAGQWVEAAHASALPLFEAQSVVVVPPLCKAEWFPLAPFLDSLRVELAGRGLHCCTLANSGDGKPTDPALHVRVEIVPCATDADRVQVFVRTPTDSRVVEREVSLADVAQPARPRALALAVAELIRSLGQGALGETPAAIAIPAQSALPSSASSRAEDVRPATLSLHVEAEARAFPTRDTMMWGGRARLTGHWRKLHADLDLGGNSARTRGELGDVLLRSASAGLGLGPRFAAWTFIIDLGLHAEVGWAWIRGEPAFADVKTNAGSALISSVGFRLSLEAPVQVRIRPTLTLESGGVVRGVKAEVNGQPVAGMTGYYLLAALGFAVSP